MLYGFISDVHGDLPALERALQHLAHVDALLFLGDAVGGRQDRECLDVLKASGIPCLCGNHDLDPSDLQGLSEEWRAWLAKLPPLLETEHFLALHSLFHERPGYRRYEYVYDVGEATDVFRRYPHRLVFMGHTHVPCLFEHRPEETSRTLIEDSTVRDLHGERRYVVNVGMARTTCVTYDSEQDRLSWHVFEHSRDRMEVARAGRVQANAPLTGSTVPWWKFW